MSFTLLKDQTNKKSVSLPKKPGSFKLLSQQNNQQPSVKPGESIGQIVDRSLPANLGGGVYRAKVGDSNYNANLEHSTYGGVTAKPGFERADIFPVSLSGVNTDKKNIVMEKNLPAFDKASLAKEKGQPYNEGDLKYRTATDKYLMEEILPKYKSGEMSLREAQVKSVSYLRNEQEGLNKAMKNENLGGQIGAFTDDFVHTANKIGSLLGKKVGIIANKLVKKNQPAMTFKVGEGLNPEGQAQAQDVINYEVAKGAEESKKLPLPTQIKNAVVDQARKGMPDYQKYTEKQNAPIIAEKKKTVAANTAYEKTLTPQQLSQKNDPLFISSAKMASEVLGREIKPENYVNEEKNFSPEQKNLINAKLEENTAETIAKVVTAPIRFTIGAIARDYAMTEDELKGYNEKFVPTSDVEKLIYGEEPITNISNSEDLYGIIGKNIGIPAAIATMIAFDLNLPGPKTLMKKYFEEKVAKEGIEKVAKVGADEYIKLIDEAIASEVRLGKVTEEQVIEATANAKKGIEELNNNNKVKPSLPKKPKTSPVEPKTVQIGAKPKKVATLPPAAKKAESDAIANDLEKATVDTKYGHIIYRGTGKNVGGVNDFIPGGKSYASHEEMARLFGKKIEELDITGKKILDLDKIKNPTVKMYDKMLSKDPERAVRELKEKGYIGVRFNGDAEDPNLADDLGGMFEYRLFGDKETVNNSPFTNLSKRDILKVEKQAYKDTIKNGGVTIDLGGNKPTKGYSYSPFKDTETIVPEKEFTQKHIDDFYQKNIDKLNQEGNHIGIWKDNGSYYLDVSRVGEPNSATIKAAHDSNQLGVFDLESLSRGNDGTIQIGKIKNGKYSKLDKPENLHKNYVKSYERTNLPSVGKGKNTGTSIKGSNGSNKKVRGGKTKNKKKVTLPKKEKIVYKPIEKPVDLRKKIKVEKIESKPAKISQRLSDDAIEKGIVDEFGDLPEIDKKTFKGEAKKIGQIIDNGKQDDLVKIALGNEKLAAEYEISPSSAFITVKNQALKDKNIELLRELAMNEKSVPNQSKIWGQNIKFLDEGLEDDAFRNIRKVVENRKNNATNKSSKTAKSVRAKANKIIAEAKPNKYDWSNLVKEITCKV